MTRTPGYLLDNTAPDSADRFGGLAGLFDPVTARHLDIIGVSPGWSCWEVGAGGPSVPRMLAQRVGTAGQVVATDLEIRWLGTDLPIQVRALRHDVVRDEPPDGRFDLVHARLVLVHLPEREAVLRRLVAALRPGGWLLVEDFDCALQPLACLEARTPAQERANRVRAEFLGLLAGRGVDLEYGRTLPRRLREAGLGSVGADGFFPVCLPAGARLELANVRQTRDGLLAGGRLTEAELDAHLASVASGEIDVLTPPLIAAWGRG